MFNFLRKTTKKVIDKIVLNSSEPIRIHTLEASKAPINSLNEILRKELNPEVDVVIRKTLSDSSSFIINEEYFNKDNINNLSSKDEINENNYSTEAKSVVIDEKEIEDSIGEFTVITNAKYIPTVKHHSNLSTKNGRRILENEVTPLEELHKSKASILADKINWALRNSEENKIHYELSSKGFVDLLYLTKGVYDVSTFVARYSVAPQLAVAELIFCAGTNLCVNKDTNDYVVGITTFANAFMRDGKLYTEVMKQIASPNIGSNLAFDLSCYILQNVPGTAEITTFVTADWVPGVRNALRANGKITKQGGNKFLSLCKDLTRTTFNNVAYYTTGYEYKGNAEDNTSYVEFTQKDIEEIFNINDKNRDNKTKEQIAEELRQSDIMKNLVNLSIEENITEKNFSEKYLPNSYMKLSNDKKIMELNRAETLILERQASTVRAAMPVNR